MTFPASWLRRAAITIEADQVSGTGSLTDFPVFLDGTVLDDTGIFNTTYGAQPDAGDIRFSSDAAGATQLPCDIAYFDKTNSLAGIYVKATIDGTTDTTIYVWWKSPNAGELRADRDGTYGGEAVWSDYEAMYALFGPGSTMDRTAQGRHLPYGNVSRTNRSVVNVNYEATKYNAFPSMIKLANGDLLLACRRADIHLDDVDGYTQFYRSTDAGYSWSELSTIGASDTTRDYRDCNLYQDDDASGTVYCVLFKVNLSGTEGTDKHLIYYYRSTDNGATWDSGTQLTTVNGAARGKPLRLESGLIAVPWYEIDSSAQSRPMLTVIDPSDQSKTDYTVNATFNTYNEWTLTEDTSTSPNTLRGYFRSATADGVYTSTATVDALGTWGTFTTAFTTNARDAPEAQRISTGDILCVHAFEDAPTNANVRLMRSTDNGATWVTSDYGYLVVEDEPITNGTGYYPSFCEINNGLFAWAIFADSSGGAAPAYIITGHFELDADGRLAGTADRGFVPIVSDGTGGAEFPNDTTHSPRALTTATADTIQYPHTNNTFTLGALIQHDAYTNTTNRAIWSNASATSTKGFRWYYGATNDDFILNRYLGDSSTNTYTSDANAIADNNMHVVHCSLDTGVPTFYVDGVAKGGTGSNTGTTTGNAAYPQAIGRSQAASPTLPWDGQIGWVYCRKSAISADWAATESNNWADPDVFATGAAAVSPRGFRHSLLLGAG